MSHAFTREWHICNHPNLRHRRLRARKPGFCTLATAVGVREAGDAEAHKRALSPPNVFISTKKSDIDVCDLAALYKLAAATYLTTGSRQKHRHFEHWTDEALQQRLALVLERSVAVAAAFTRDPRFCNGGDGWLQQPRPQQQQQPQRSNGSPGGGFSGPQPDWLLAAWRPRQQRIVGFVRAAGDRSLVATLHDLAVHPALHGSGVGTRLLRGVVQQVSALGIWDVGLVTPSELQPFFRGASFDLDHEGSLPMALGDVRAAELLAPGGGEEVTARIASNRALERMLQRALL